MEPQPAATKYIRQLALISNLQSPPLPCYSAKNAAATRAVPPAAFAPTGQRYTRLHKRPGPTIGLPALATNRNGLDKPNERQKYRHQRAATKHRGGLAFLQNCASPTTNFHPTQLKHTTRRPSNAARAAIWLMEKSAHIPSHIPPPPTACKTAPVATTDLGGVQNNRGNRFADRF